MQLTTNLDASKTYRMLQLTPKLRTSLEEGTLSLKSNESGLVFACTDKSTHLVRVLKQTNTLLVSQYVEDRVRVFASPSSTLETVEVPGSIDWSAVPEYLGSSKPGNESSLNITQAIEKCCCSHLEFQEQCRVKPAAEIDGRFYRISPEVVYNVLVFMVSTMAEKGDLDLRSDPKSLKLNTDEPQEVIQAVYDMFASEDSLDASEIGKWIGTHILRKYPGGIAKAEFIKEWKYDLPINTRTDPSILYGSLIELNGSKYHFLDAKTLPSDPKLLFQKLFSIKPEWLVAEIEPFISIHVPASEKLDNWVLKYARKKRIGTDIYLTPLRR